jgi:hypothetical protein
VHPFPSSAQLQRFRGDAIAQIWLDPWGLRFLFESKTQVYAQERVDYTDSAGVVWRYNCDDAGGPALILQRLLYKRIIAIEREDFCLTFRIEDGSSLTLISELGPYESGAIETSEGVLDLF